MDVEFILLVLRNTLPRMPIHQDLLLLTCYAVLFPLGICSKLQTQAIMEER